MPYTSLYVHAVWATKNREPDLTKDIRYQVFKHILENAKKKNIRICNIGGYIDHIHLLFILDPTQTVANILNLIKGESSYWINKSMLLKTKFEWQDEYYAVSVSPTIVKRVQNYIKNQEVHHQKKPFAQEYDYFIKDCQSEK